MHRLSVTCVSISVCVIIETSASRLCLQDIVIKEGAGCVGWAWQWQWRSSMKLMVAGQC